jgi:hypothetical protein
MIIGLYFMTTIKEGGMGEGRVFGSLAEAQLAFDSHNLDLQAQVNIREIFIDGRVRLSGLNSLLNSIEKKVEEEADAKRKAKMLERIPQVQKRFREFPHVLPSRHVAG